MARKEPDISYLPVKAREKLLALRERRDEAMMLARETQNKIGELREDLERGELHLKRLAKPQVMELAQDLSHFHPRHESDAPPPQYRMGLLHPDSPKMVEARREQTRLLDQIERAQIQLAKYEAQFTSLGNLVRQIENYLLSIDGEVREHKPAIEVTLRKNETVTDALEERRRHGRQLKAAAERVDAAPIHSSAAKSKIKAYVEQLRARGAPSLFDLIESGSLASISIPEKLFQTQFHGGDKLGNPIVVAAHIPQPDLLAVLAWLAPDMLLKRFNEQIMELQDDEHSFDPRARADKLEEIASDALAVEREEEALVTQAEAQGLTIARRPDSDPRAVLSLASSLPAPDNEMRNQI